MGAGMVSHGKGRDNQQGTGGWLRKDRSKNMHNGYIGYATTAEALAAKASAILAYEGTAEYFWCRASVETGERAINAALAAQMHEARAAELTGELVGMGRDLICFAGFSDFHAHCIRVTAGYARPWIL